MAKAEGRLQQMAWTKCASRARRGQATHPQGGPVDGLCEVRASDHCSPTTAYGLTRFACRTAVLVGVDAMQDENKRGGCAGIASRADTVQHRPSASSCGVWAPRPRGRAQTRAVRRDNQVSIKGSVSASRRS